MAVTDLAAWLLQQIADDERVAREAVKGAGGHQWEVPGGEFNTVRVEVWDAANADPSYDDSEGWYPPLVYDEGACGEEPAAHIARWDPARVLAECEAKRRIVDAWQRRWVEAEAAPQHLHAMFASQATGLGTAVHVIAAVYADRPGYLEEWRP